MSENKIECSNHGSRKPAFICQHLDKVHIRGFIEPIKDPSEERLDPFEEFNAWCHECEKIRMQEGGWNDRSEAFAQIKLICDACFEEIKKLNSNQSPE